jgi:siroheme synthase-like protein
MTELSKGPSGTGAEQPVRYYPLFLDLTERLVVVIGGGAVAEEKVRGLLAAGARVRVVAPVAAESLAALAAEHSIEHLARPYRDGDLAGAFLVFAERGDAELSRAVFAEAERRGIFCNVQDEVPHCSAIAPATFRRGDLQVAITTGGAAPALAVRLRERLERELGAEIAEFLVLARRLRAPLATAVPDFTERRRRWYALVDSEALALLRRGESAAARALAEQILGVTAKGDSTEPRGAPTQPSAGGRRPR